MERILIIRLGALGDVVNVMPAVHAVRRAQPEAHLAWVVEEGAHDLVASVRDVDEAIRLPRREWSRALRRPWRWPWLARDIHAFFGKLRDAGFAVTLDFQGSLKSGVVARLSGTARRVGFAAKNAREFNWLFSNDRAPAIPQRVHRVEKALALARHAFPAEAEVAWPEIVLSEEDERAAENFARGLRRPLVLIHPGTSAFGAFKRWPAERFGEVARRLVEERGASVVVTWGPGERELAEQVCRASGGRAVPADERSGLGQLAAVIRRADLMIASDTGPLHLAVALGTPVVAIFGPKDPVIYGPYGTGHGVVRQDAPCAPCTRRRCRDMICMTRVAPDDVFGAAWAKLSEIGQAPAKTDDRR